MVGTWGIQFRGILAALAVATGFLTGIGAATPGSPPNIILIMADDLGIRDFQSLPTPALDRMAEEGMSFTFAHATPLCTPSRVQIMTGVYNFRNYTRFGELRPGETTFAHLLKSAGYRTCVVGKWQLGGNAYTPYAFGFDDYCLWQLTVGGYQERYHNPRILRNAVPETYRNGEFGPRLFVDHLKRFVAENQDVPFFVYYPMVLPHRPNVPTPHSPSYAALAAHSFAEAASDPRHFPDQVRYLDALVGEIIEYIDEAGLGERTLILFTTDNGTSDEVEVDMAGRPVPGQKGRTNILGTHVPLLARWSATITPGTSDRMVDFTDFLPTMAEAAGLPAPLPLQTDGISFFRDLLNQPGPRRDWIFCHYAPGKNDDTVTRFVHDREWKVYGEGTVYHIAGDPLETAPVDPRALDGPTLGRLDVLRDILQQMK